MKSLVILAGQPGTGKTAVRQRLAPQIEATSLGPDDHPNKWRWVLPQMDVSAHVLLECCKVPRSVVRIMPLNTIVVELKASPEVRKQRLEQQGHDEATVIQRLANSPDLGYEHRITPGVSVDTSDLDPDRATDAVRDALSETPWVEARWRSETVSFIQW